ncbi:MAG TPA: glycosyltransferase family 2 protein [Spirochaetota bacterium]|mgnify:CR=1 FL=1|nr:glycosyltransferase family 2 protein [Spirochaetota bacterium]
MKLAGATVLYNPDISILDNIRTYIDEIDLLIIVDNSEIQNKKLISKLKKYGKKIQYISYGENLGIAKALNTAAKLAIEKGFSHLLTMDQDSRFDKKNISVLKRTAIKNIYRNYAVIAPVFTLKNESSDSRINHSHILTEVKSVITSGCLLNLEAFNSAGGFCEKLFIDQVDHEFCLRARKHGYKTYIIRDCFLNHKLGDSESIKILFFKTRVTNHNYIRRYYMTRNSLYLAAHYWAEIPETIRKMTADNLKMIIIEKEKIKKLRSVILGFFDFVRGHYGKYNH